MGGRGGSSGMAKTQSLEEYLGERGLSSPISDYMVDKMRIPHGMTARQISSFLKMLKRQGQIIPAKETPL